MPLTQSTAVLENKTTAPPPGNLYERRTMQNEPSFILFYYVDLPIFILGVLFNGFILYRLVPKSKSLLSERLERVMTLLFAAYFSWSVGATFIYTIWLFHASEWFYKLSAIITSVQIVLLFGGNTLLALERFFLIKEFTFDQSRPYFLGACCSIGAMVGLIGALFVSSPSYDGIWPANPVEQSIWTVSMLFSFIAMSVAIVVLYTLTYLHSSKMLREGLEKAKAADPVFADSLVHIQLERKILKKCCIMAGSLFMCYVPEALSFILVRTLHLDQREPRLFMFQSIARALLVLDVIVTPALILYFMPSLRRAVFGGKVV